MPTKFRRVWFCVTLVLALPAINPTVSRADDFKPPDLPAALGRALAWLPEDTEAIVVGQSFVIPTPEPDGVAPPTPVEPAEALRLMSGSALGALVEPDMDKYLKPLFGKKVVLALRGGRNYEWVSASLPAYRTEGCAVVVFEKELGEAATEWVSLLRSEAQEVRMIAGRSVFVFPPTRSMRPARKSKWPGKLGVYVVLLNSETILCATSDKYLEQLLERVDTAPAKRALPDSLPEWQHVNLKAPAWMLRHNSKSRSRWEIQGIIWTVTNDRVQVVYLPAAGEEENAATAVRRSWQRRTPDGHPPVDVNLTIERLADRVVVASSMADMLNSDAMFLFLMNLYWLEASFSHADSTE